MIRTEGRKWSFASYFESAGSPLYLHHSNVYIDTYQTHVFALNFTIHHFPVFNICIFVLFVSYTASAVSLPDYLV